MDRAALYTRSIFLGSSRPMGRGWVCGWSRSGRVFLGKLALSRRGKAEQQPLASRGKTLKIKYPHPRSVLAVVAYLLVCIGPLGMIILATDAPVEAHERPHPLPMLIGGGLVLLIPVGLVLGIVALARGRKTAHLPSSGIPHAYAAIGVGISGLVVSFPFLPVRGQHLDKSETSCLSNVKQLGLGMQMYAQDYDENLPIRRNWNDAVYPYIKNWSAYQCPYAEDQNQPTYAMNQFVSGVKPKDMGNSEQTVLLFDSVPGKNLAGSAGLFPDPPRHYDSQTIGFCDGHVKLIKESNLGSLIWQPDLKVPAKKKK